MAEYISDLDILFCFTNTIGMEVFPTILLEGLNTFFKVKHPFHVFNKNIDGYTYHAKYTHEF